MRGLDPSSTSLATSPAVQSGGSGQASTAGHPAWTQALAEASAMSAGAAPPAGTSGSPTTQTGSASADASWAGQAWDWTKREATAGVQAISIFDATHGHVLTRVAGAAQAIGGIAETATGAAVAGLGTGATATGIGAAPGIPAVVGGSALALNGVDNAAAGLQTALTGQFHHTVISQAAGDASRALGASSEAAERVTNGVELAQGLVGGGATGAVWRRAAVSSVARATGPEMQWINPSELRFSQTSAGGSGRAHALRASMAEDGWKGPPIDAVRTPQGLVAIDNTRPALAQELGLDSIPVRVWNMSDALPASMTETSRFGPSQTWGDALAYRTGRQLPPLDPTGTAQRPRLPGASQ